MKKSIGCSNKYYPTIPIAIGTQRNTKNRLKTTLCDLCVFAGHSSAQKKDSTAKLHWSSLLSRTQQRSTHNIYPAKQYVHPCSCARLIAQIPAGITCTPGNKPLTQSFFTSAASRPIDCATTPLYTVNAIS